MGISEVPNRWDRQIYCPFNPFVPRSLTVEVDMESRTSITRLGSCGILDIFREQSICSVTHFSVHLDIRLKVSSEPVLSCKMAFTGNSGIQQIDSGWASAQTVRNPFNGLPLQKLPQRIYLYFEVDRPGISALHPAPGLEETLPVVPPEQKVLVFRTVNREHAFHRFPQDSAPRTASLGRLAQF